MDTHEEEAFQEYRDQIEDTGSDSESSQDLRDLEAFNTENNNLTNMANLMMMGLGKPIQFTGEKGGVTVDQFIDTLELTFMMMESSFPTPDRLARAQLLAFQNLLDGKAKQWWYTHATAANKASYAAAVAALRTRFPTDVQAHAEELEKAMAAFNVMKQNGRTVEEYIEHATELLSVLGNDFQHLLAMRFVDGIENIGTRQAVDAQVEEPYTLNAVIAAYRKSTKSIRRLESYQDKTKQLSPSPSNNEILKEDPLFREMICSQEKLAAMYLDSQNKIMQQVSEAVKSAQAAAGTSQGSAGYTQGRASTTANSGYAPGRAPTCVLCGKLGHLSCDCRSTPLPLSEQYKLREKHLPPRPPPAGIVTAVASIEELNPEELGVVSYSNEPEGTMTLPVSMIEEVIGQSSFLVEKPKSRNEYLMDLFAAMPEDDRDAWIAAAEKRVREEDEEGGMGQPATKRQNPNPPAAATPADDSQTQADSQGGRPFVPDPRYANPEATRQFQEQQPAFRPTAARKPAVAKKEPGPKKTIRMMSGTIPWDALEALRKTPVVGLDWGSFLALAPSVKADLCKGLVLVKAPQAAQATPVSAQVNAVSQISMGKKDTKSKKVEVCQLGINQQRNDDMGFLYGNAVPEPVGPITNFYTTGIITNQSQGNLRAFRIPKVLIDGGAVVNLMPESVVARLGLPCEPNDDIVIRTATNELHPVLRRTHFNIAVGGVLASIRAYVIDQSLSYSLILGRRWMQQVRAIGDYRTHSYIIFDQFDQPHRVPVATGKEDLKEEQSLPSFPDIMPNPMKSRNQMDLTDAEYEELLMGRGRMDALLNQIIREAEEEIEQWDADEEEDDSANSDNEKLAQVNALYTRPTMVGKGRKY